MKLKHLIYCHHVSIVIMSFTIHSDGFQCNYCKDTFERQPMDSTVIYTSRSCLPETRKYRSTDLEYICIVCNKEECKEKHGRMKDRQRNRDD